MSVIAKIRAAAQGLPAGVVERLRSPQAWGLVVSLAVALLLALAFFYPDASMGNELRQHDMQQGAAIGREAQAWVEAHPGAEEPRWTNSLFSGMPTFQISPTYPSDRLFRWITTAYGLGLPSPSNLLFMMMAGMLILMAALRVRWYIGLIGAVAWGFSTYFIIIIGAGHIWKFVTLSYIPPTIAGIVLAYRGRWLLGSALAGLFAMMQIQSNHPQMTYYFLFVILGVALAYLGISLRRNRPAQWLRATGALVVAACLAVGANLPSLYNTYKYSKESMRGGHSELTRVGLTPDEGLSTSGLDRDYITQYSYAPSETWSLLIPNVKGGASARPEQGRMVATSLLDVDGAQEAASQAGLSEAERQFVGAYMSQYFGDPEGTNGPVYVGALIFALFLLGCVVVRGPLKWALLVLTVLSVLLAMGRHLQWFTDLFIDYVPMYSSFRTVESILVVAEFTIPVLAVLALQRVLSVKEAAEKRRMLVAMCWTFGATALVCLAGWGLPELFGSAISEGDVRLSAMLGQQLQAAGYPQEAVNMWSINNPAIAGVVERVRYSMVSADSVRSLIFVLLGFGAVAMCLMGRAKAWMAAVMVGLIVGADLYTVNKRYLNHASFCTPSLSAADPFAPDATDRAILADTSMNFRVMNIPRFMEAGPSYHHKMVGGYHAAKLTRYQDMIDRHLMAFLQGAPSEADWRVLDMLNARYVVAPDGSLQRNPGALGNAWFVQRVDYAANPDAEMAALDSINPARTAVADRRFEGVLGQGTPTEPGDTIYETSYAPDRLTYAVRTARGGVAVFSEVYFPWGWKATVDGKPAEIARVDYLLRALRLPAGARTVEMEFRPASVTATVGLAKGCVIALYVLLFVALFFTLGDSEGKDNKDNKEGNEAATVKN